MGCAAAATVRPVLCSVRTLCRICCTPSAWSWRGSGKSSTTPSTCVGLLSCLVHKYEIIYVCSLLRVYVLNLSFSSWSSGRKLPGSSVILNKTCNPRLWNTLTWWASVHKQSSPASHLEKLRRGHSSHCQRSTSCTYHRYLFKVRPVPFKSKVPPIYEAWCSCRLRICISKFGGHHKLDLIIELEKQDMCLLQDLAPWRADAARQ